MNFLQIIQTILTVAPSGIQLTQEVVALVQAIEAAFTAGQTPASHQQAVASALGAHLAKRSNTTIHMQIAQETATSIMRVPPCPSVSCAISSWSAGRSTASFLTFATRGRIRDEQVAQVAASIAEFGWTNPILVGADGVIIAGHARLLAARKLRMTEVPVIVLDHLTETQRRALVLADNRLALNAGWDEEMLRVELESLEDDGFDLDLRRLHRR